VLKIDGLVCATRSLQGVWRGGCAGRVLDGLDLTLEPGDPASLWLGPSVAGKSTVARAVAAVLRRKLLQRCLCSPVRIARLLKRRRCGGCGGEAVGELGVPGPMTRLMSLLRVGEHLTDTWRPTGRAWARQRSPAAPRPARAGGDRRPSASTATP